MKFLKTLFLLFLALLNLGNGFPHYSLIPEIPSLNFEQLEFLKSVANQPNIIDCKPDFCLAFKESKNDKVIYLIRRAFAHESTIYYYEYKMHFKSDPDTGLTFIPLTLPKIEDRLKIYGKDAFFSFHKLIAPFPNQITEAILQDDRFELQIEVENVLKIDMRISDPCTTPNDNFIVFISDREKMKGVPSSVFAEWQLNLVNQLSEKAKSELENAAVFGGGYTGSIVWPRYGWDGKFNIPAVKRKVKELGLDASIIPVNLKDLSILDMVLGHPDIQKDFYEAWFKD